ncbi:MAG: 16S rRNA (adenine(1518)-N(6)/adenine(1519)-N(6))-dimethyltransferase RsmA [Xanthomonadales bacterium]|nr:16S rRNA (adenine(1518)-N(6)/adenine(1519)-N(6))-dimethyltransferase RsmA [Xanthomonadales bacterium]
MSEHRARKRFGQNFLQDRSVIDRIVTAINPQVGDALIEIGPGQGALTRPLLARCPQLQAIEIDRDLIAALPRQLPGLRLIEADALTVDFAALAAASGGLLRVVGNLPYNISSPLLFHLLDTVAAIRDMHFMLQWEVVERMAAGPGSKAMGRLSVMLQARCRVEPLFKVPPGAFLPVPKVDSAVVRLLPLAQQPETAVLQALSELTRLGFGQRRKTLHNTLRSHPLGSRLVDHGIDPGRRAESLTLDEWLRLAGAAAIAD